MFRKEIELKPIFIFLPITLNILSVLWLFRIVLHITLDILCLLWVFYIFLGIHNFEYFKFTFDIYYIFAYYFVYFYFPVDTLDAYYVHPIYFYTSCRCIDTCNINICVMAPLCVSRIVKKPKSCLRFVSPVIFWKINSALHSRWPSNS